MIEVVVVVMDLDTTIYFPDHPDHQLFVKYVSNLVTLHLNIYLGTIEVFLTILKLTISTLMMAIMKIHMMIIGIQILRHM